MKGGHTPGPWKLGRNHVYVYGDDEGAIVSVRDLSINRDEREIEANARLIAAAPELQEALQIVRKSLCWQVMSADLRALVEAALLKSQGES